MKLLNKAKIANNNMLSITSFNSRTVLFSVRLLRYKIIYILYYIFKKMHLLKMFYSFQYYLNIWMINACKYYDCQVQLKQQYINRCYTIVYKTYLKYYCDLFITGGWQSNSISLTTTSVEDSFEYMKEISFFMYQYKRYTYIVLLWLYSIKFLKFININVSDVRMHTKKWVVLKSPHTNKKAKESFVMKKIKKAVFYPSFLYSGRHFLLKHLDQNTALQKNTIYEFVT